MQRPVPSKFAKALLATKVTLFKYLPTYTATLLPDALPSRSTLAEPVSGAVQVNQIECTAGEPTCPGSSGSAVAFNVVAPMTILVPLNDVAFARLSFTGAWAWAMPIFQQNTKVLNSKQNVFIRNME